MATVRNSILLIFLGTLLTGGTAWADDGRIAFVGNTSGSWQIFTVTPDGSDLFQVTNMPPTDLFFWAPSFSKSGKRLVFCYGPADGQADLYTINVDGSSLKQITHDGGSCLPHWSPDETQIVFAHLTKTGTTVVTVMNSDGSGEKKRLTSDLWNSGPGGFTPDGKQIVFYSEQGGFVSAVWIMDLDGQNQERLTTAPLQGAPTDVSPDGKQVLLFSNNGSILSQLLFTVNIDTRELTQVTHSKRETRCCEFLSSFSPDGSKIAFLSNRLDPNGTDLLTIHSDGTHYAPLEKNVRGGVSWGPVPK